MIWILVIGQNKANLFSHKKIFPHLAPLNQFKFECEQYDGNTKPLELSPYQRQFYIQLAESIERSRKNNEFRHLVLASTPQALEFLYRVIDPLSRASIIGTLLDDYLFQPLDKLAQDSQNLIWNWLYQYNAS